MPTSMDDHSTPLTRLVGRITGWLGSFGAIAVSTVLIMAWAAGLLVVPGGVGNDSYGLAINTLTTIVTFLMVFIIQNTQNRDGRAMQAKLDAQARALIAIADELGVDTEMLDELIGVEDAPEKVIKQEQALVRRRK